MDLHFDTQSGILWASNALAHPSSSRMFPYFLLEHCEHFEHDEQPMQVEVPDLRAA